jgi:hypothetical protein
VIAVAIAIAALSSGVGSTATAYDPPSYGNAPPDCSGVTIAPSTLAATGQFVLVALSGATDTDGDELSYHIDGVTQDEPVFGPPGTTDPDAKYTTGGADSASVLIRAEKDPRGNGRVYFVAYTVSDGTDGCSGVARVGVPRKKGVAAVADSSRWNSFTGAPT